MVSLRAGLGADRSGVRSLPLASEDPVKAFDTPPPATGGDVSVKLKSRSCEKSPSARKVPGTGRAKYVYLVAVGWMKGRLES